LLDEEPSAASSFLDEEETPAEKPMLEEEPPVAYSLLDEEDEEFAVKPLLDEEPSAASSFLDEEETPAEKPLLEEEPPVASSLLDEEDEEFAVKPLLDEEPSAASSFLDEEESPAEKPLLEEEPPVASSFLDEEPSVSEEEEFAAVSSFLEEDDESAIKPLPEEELSEKSVLEQKNASEEEPEPETSINSENFPMIEESMIKALQIFENRLVSGVLEFRGRQEKAAIYFQDGRIIHAYHDKAKGKKALFRIFSETGGKLVFRSHTLVVDSTVKAPLKRLLEKGNSEIKTLRRLKPESFEKSVHINPELPNHEIHEIHETTSPELSSKFADVNRPGVKYILTLVRHFGRVRDIMDASLMTDLQTYKHIQYMLQKRILILGKKPDKKKAGIQLVTDSSADLPADIIRDRDIVLMPHSVTVNNKICLDDGINLIPSSFYRTLKKSDSFPETSPPSAEDFHALFQEIVPDKDILGIFMSGKISTLSDHAKAVKDTYFHEYSNRRGRTGGENLKLEIIDSQLISMGMGLLVTEAADKIEKGMEIEELRDYIEKLIPKVRVFFVAENLKYLEKSGRIETSGTLLDNFLRAKPILIIREGEIVAVDRVRGEKNAQEVVIELIRQILPDPGIPIKAGIMHADAPMRANRMRDLMENRFNCQNMIMSQIGAAVGTYCGPGTVAVAFFPITDEV
jgi:DegV family protein with EDD domain